MREKKCPQTSVSVTKLLSRISVKDRSGCRRWYGSGTIATRVVYTGAPLVISINAGKVAVAVAHHLLKAEGE